MMSITFFIINHHLYLTKQKPMQKKAMLWENNKQFMTSVDQDQPANPQRLICSCTTLKPQPAYMDHIALIPARSLSTLVPEQCPKFRMMKFQISLPGFLRYKCANFKHHYNENILHTLTIVIYLCIIIIVQIYFIKEIRA